MLRHALVDATPLLERQFGIGYYVKHLTQALAARADLDIHGLYRYVRRAGKHFPDWMPVRSLRLPHRATDLIFGALNVPADRILGTDLFHATTLFLPRFSRTPSVLTVYDLAFKVNPDWFPWSADDFDRRLQRALARASHVITISESTRQDLLAHYDVDPGRVTPILLGPSHGLDTDAQVARDPDLPENYFLSVGTLEPRKNLVRTIEAWSAADVEEALVLVGEVGWKAEPILKAIADSPKRDRIVRVGYAPTEKMRGIYRFARALIYPSLYEGFGLPALEAMCCGTPVILSRNSSLPEIGGEAAFYVDPLDGDGMRMALERLAGDADLHSDLSLKCRERARLFDWKVTAEQTAGVYAALSGGGRPPRG